jgi:hypothetical protein
MPIISCPECGRDMSDKALACVACGYMNAGYRLVSIDHNLQTVKAIMVFYLIVNIVGAIWLYSHSSIVMTLDTYSHVLPSMQQAATEKLEKMLFG